MKIQSQLMFLVVIILPVAWANADTGSGWTVAIIDTGYNKNYTEGKIVRSTCISRNTQYTQFPFNIGSIVSTEFTYQRLSKCANDQDFDSSSNAVNGRTLPRVKLLEFYDDTSGPLPPARDFLEIYSNHGTNVLSQVIKVAPDVNIYPITVGAFVGSNTINNGIINESSCQNNTSYTQGRDTYHQRFRCFEDTNNADLITGVFAVILRPDNVIATNLSSGSPSIELCSQQTNNSTFQEMLDKGIIPVAAAGNNSNLPVHWPACLSNVVAVAQTMNGQPIGSPVNGEEIEYFAEVSGNKVTENELLSGSSFAAPLVSGAFAAMKSANPNATISELKEVLHNTGDVVTGFSARRINVAAAVQAIKNINTLPPTTPPAPPAQPPTPPGQTAELGIKYNGIYGIGSVFSVNLNGSVLNPNSNNITLSPLANANLGVTNVRDISLSFEGEFYAPNSSSNNSLSIIVNGVRRINFNGAQSNINTLDFKQYNFMLNRNWLRSGSNEISIAPTIATSLLTGRITSVAMDYNPPITINTDQKITTLYGHFVGTKKHLTGLRVEFASLDSDAEFSATGFDIDSATEIAVFLNQKRIGYLKRGLSNHYNSEIVFELKKEEFVSSGVNTIEFVQTSSSDRENWGVINMELIGVNLPNISGALMLLLGE